uniref:Uncharacterized protein n=1 Tax=Sipha flava TaxID=143950 RepID=A0A2S2PYP7_9HEMI
MWSGKKNQSRTHVYEIIIISTSRDCFHPSPKQRATRELDHECRTAGTGVPGRQVRVDTGALDHYTCGGATSLRLFSRGEREYGFFSVVIHSSSVRTFACKCPPGRWRSEDEGKTVRWS